MQHPPVVSVLMTVRNTEHWIAACLRSLIQQTETRWELCVVDDHSTDDTGCILHQFAQKDPRIIALKPHGKGIIDGLRKAYAYSCGPYLTRMDGDDLAHPKKLERLLGALQQSGLGHVAVGQVAYFTENGLVGEGYRKYANWLNRLTETGANYLDRYKECVIPSICWMVHRNDFEKAGAFEPNRYPEDYDMAFRFYEAALNIAPVKEVIHSWRDYGERTSRNSEVYADNRFLNLKTWWFLRLDRENGRPLVLWGAGKKGKVIARLLQDFKQPFHWVCETPSKIGHVIHGVKMEETQILKCLEKPQIIVAVANADDKAKITHQLKGMGWVQSRDYFLFC